MAYRIDTFQDPTTGNIVKCHPGGYIQFLTADGKWAYRGERCSEYTHVDGGSHRRRWFTYDALGNSKLLKKE